MSAILLLYFHCVEELLIYYVDRQTIKTVAMFNSVLCTIIREMKEALGQRLILHNANSLNYYKSNCST